MKIPKERILLLGASSRIGRYFWKQLRAKDAVGTYASHAFAGGFHFDVNKDLVEFLVHPLERFSHAIVLVGETNFDRCAQDLKRSEEINIVSMNTYAMVTRKGVRFAFNNTLITRNLDTICNYSIVSACRSKRLYIHVFKLVERHLKV